VAESELVEQAAEELYGLPPGEFTRARDARVKEVRKDGDREAADAIKALRKPTVAAWALNQLARRRSKDLEGLLSAGEELRAAQEELLGGGDRSAFQEAASRERELVAELSVDATALASEAGERAGGLQEKVAATLHAAALDEETAEQLRAGRLTREREAIGGFGAADSAAAPSSTKLPAKARAKTPQPRSKSTTKSTREAASNRQRLAAAKTDERHARRELDAAARAVEHAQERAEAAEAHAAETAERARTTAERLKEAKRAESAARKAHTRAARALESAERASAKKT
jgi:hypothetical protein